jgi:uncharacterized protein with von Willebrand factor type A (vWA) domain
MTGNRRSGVRRGAARVLQIDARMSWSKAELIREKDFEQMSRRRDRHRGAGDPHAGAAGPARSPPVAAGALASRPPPGHARDVAKVAAQGRRGRPAAARRTGRRPPNLVALCDISGSMSAYSRMLLHFLHAATERQGRGLGQGACLHLRHAADQRHPPPRPPRRRRALAAPGGGEDWEGGTRIGHCLHVFNRDWSRRVLAQGAVVLLITDGLDRDDPDRWSARRSGWGCRRAS